MIDSARIRIVSLTIIGTLMLITITESGMKSKVSITYQTFNFSDVYQSKETER
jgi:hypothetical protein